MGVMPTLLQSMNEERAASAERLRLEVRQALRAALTDLLPGRSVTVFGSLTQTGRFTEYSDVDLALRELPADLSLYQLIALLSERLGRRVDVVMLCETRLRDKIAREVLRIWCAGTAYTMETGNDFVPLFKGDVEDFLRQLDVQYGVKVTNSCVIS